MPEPSVPPLSISMPSAAGSANIPGTPGGRSGLPRKPKPGTGTPDIKEGSPHSLDHEPGSAYPAPSEGVISSHSISTSMLSAAGSASVPDTPGGRSGQPRRPKPGAGMPDIEEGSPYNLDYEPGSADPARSKPNASQETQDKQTDHGAPASTVGHRSYQPRKKVATPRPLTGQDSSVVFYEEQLERLRSELSRASARAVELQQRHDAQSKVLDSAHSQLKIKTEQITNARREYEKLQGDLSAHSAQTTDLQKRYHAQSQDILSTRHELQAKVLLLEEKEHVIISLSDKVAQAERENSTMADQVATAQGAVDQLRGELSSASSRTADVQKRYEAQSREFDTARDELHQLKGLYQGNSSGRGVADQIRSALKEKNQQIEVLRKDLAASTSRNDELQKLYETLSREVSGLGDELTVKTSQYEGTITSLNAQVERWKSADGANKEQIATSLKQVKGLQNDLTSSASQLAQLEGRYDVQSRELTAVREELQFNILSSESKERTIVSLTTEVAQWKDASASKTVQLATALKQVEELQRDPTSIPRYIELQTLYEEQTGRLDAAQQSLSTSASDIEKLRNLYEERSNELTAVRKELNASISSGESKDLTIAALDIEVQKWKDAGANESKQVAASLEKAKKLEDDLSTSTSKLGELERLHEDQSSEFIRLRDELQTSVSSAKDKDLIISTLTTEIEQWKGAGVDEPKKVTVILELVKKLRGNISTSTSKLDELQNLHEKQSGELASARDDLQASISSGKDKDLTIAALTDEVQQWKDAGANESKQVATLLEQTKRLQDDLATSTSKFDGLQNLYQNQSDALTVVHDELQASISSGKDKDLIIATLTAELGEWKSVGVDEPKKVVVILEQIERLQQEHSASTSQLVQLRTLYEERSRELTVVQEKLQSSISSGKGTDPPVVTPTKEVQQRKDASASESKEVVTIFKRVEKHQQDLSTSASELEKLHNLYKKRLSELAVVRPQDRLRTGTLSDKDRDLANATEVQRWKDAGGPEQFTVILKQVTIILRQVKRLGDELSLSASQLDEFQTLYKKQSDELAGVYGKLRTSISSSEGKDLTLAALTAEVERLKATTLAEGEQHQQGFSTPTSQFAELPNLGEGQSRTTREQIENDLSTSASQLADLRVLYEKQSGELTAFRDGLQASISSGKDKDLTVAALTDEIQQWKDAGTDGSKQVATLLKQVKRLQNDLATSTSKLDEVRTVHRKQSGELVAVHNQLEASISSGKDKDLIITTLTAEVGQWKSVGIDEPKKVVLILEQLRQEHSSSTSQLVQLRTLYEERSSKFTIVQEELQASILSGKDKDLTITALADEVQQWKDASAMESREVATILTQVGKLQQSLSTSISEFENLHNRYEEQSSKLTAVQEELEASIITGKKQDITIAALTDEVQRWNDAGANESMQVATILEQVNKLQSDLSTSASELAEFKVLYEQQLRDLTDVRKELQVRILSEEGKDRELAVARKDLEQLHDNLATSTSQIERLKESEFATADELTAAHKELEQLHIDLSASSSQIIEFRQRYEAQSSQLEQWKNSAATKAVELTAAGEKLELRRQELSTLSSQLDKVHRFLTIADTYADTAIIQMVQKLNAEVQQNTTFIAECILEASQPHAKASSKEQNTAIQRVSVYIGQALTDSLRKKRDDLALYLPIAFQAYLTNYLSGVISAWTTEEGHSDLIDTIYQRLQREEAQTISGHWRSLTRTYISPTCRSHPDTIISFTVAGLSDILVVAGCATSASAAKSTVSPKFLDKVSSIISIAGQLSKMIGEVVSSDFEVLAVRPDVVFEGTTMEEDVDDYDDIRDTAGGTATGEKVLCSTQLGLTKRMPLESGKVTLTAMRTKVLLESFLIA